MALIKTVPNQYNHIKTGLIRRHLKVKVVGVSRHEVEQRSSEGSGYSESGM